MGIDLQLCRASIGLFRAIQSKARLIGANRIGIVVVEVWHFGPFWQWC
jgi:hypothetical protein